MAYHNAVTDKLLIVSYSSETHYVVINNADAIKWFTSNNGEALPKELDNAIFSDTTIVYANSNFVLAPSHQIEPELLYNLSYGNKANVEVEKLEDLNVVYHKTSRAFGKNLVLKRETTDIAEIINYSRNRLQNTIRFYELDKVLTLQVVEKGKLQLLNRYAVADLNELFYHIMNVLEQLSIEPGSISFECISTRGMHENYQSIFKNYLPQLKLVPLDVEISTEDAHIDRNKLAFTRFIAQCVL